MSFNHGDKVIVASRTSLYGLKGIVDGDIDCGGYNLVTDSGSKYWCLRQELHPDVEPDPSAN